VVYVVPYNLFKEGQFVDFSYFVCVLLGMEEDLAVEAGVSIILPMGSWI